MAFDVSYEAAEMMNQLARTIPHEVDQIHSANEEITRCYNSVQHTIGPHTRRIESIVHNVEKLLKQNADEFSRASDALVLQSNRVRRILDAKYQFRESLKVSVTHVASGNNASANPSGDPTIGALNRNKGNQTEYEL